ncbi:hypothetical protein GOV06_02835 [Candidatus Woesearchaeota archaeon]|nr:hypothetical protein [Candidatus Woesearchaeota archaeon]
MERITQKELIGKLQKGDYKLNDLFISEVIVLDDTLWGLENGVYKPLGELQIAMQYSNGTYQNAHNEPSYTAYDMLSVLSHDFSNGTISRYDDGSPSNLEDHVGYIKEKHLFVRSEGQSGIISARRVIQEFITKFLDVYQKRHELKNDEAKECLQKSFVKYD